MIGSEDIEIHGRCRRVARAWSVRVVVLLATLAVPLLAAGSAQASIAGANPSRTTDRPDVRTAAAVDAQEVQVCFDKPLSSTSAVISDPTMMHLVGYSAVTNRLDPIAATLVTANSQCVNLAFSTHSGTLDLGQFTAVAISDGAVTAGGQPNLADSVTLSTSTTHNGTAGLSTGPDLVGPAPVTSPANSIAYVFDQSVEPDTAPSPARHFWYENAAGNFCFSTTVTQANPTTFIATFPTAVSGTCNDTAAPTPSVANARRAGVDGGVLRSIGDFPTSNAPQGTTMPDADGGATAIASVISATLDNSSGDQVTFNFDHPLNAASITDASKFAVVLANGIPVFGDSVSASGPNSVLVTFNGMDFFDEYAVQAVVEQTAVQANPPTSGCSSNVTPCPMPSTFTASPDAVPIGGNAGAFARGFTTGPDVYMVAFNTTTNVATLFLDQRVAEARGGTAGINLIDGQGDVLGQPTNITIPSFPNPGPAEITMDVSPSVMALNPVQIQLDGPLTFSGVEGFCELDTAIGPDGCSVPQIVQESATAVHIKAVRHLSRHYQPHKRRKRR